MGMSVETRALVTTVRAWVEHMEEGEFTRAYGKAIDAWAIGEPAAEQLTAHPTLPALQSTPRLPRELLEGMAGFMLCLAALCESEAAKKRGGGPPAGRGSRR